MSIPEVLEAACAAVGVAAKASFALQVADTESREGLSEDGDPDLFDGDGDSGGDDDDSGSRVSAALTHILSVMCWSGGARQCLEVWQAAASGMHDGSPVVTPDNNRSGRAFFLWLLRDVRRRAAPLLEAVAGAEMLPPDLFERICESAGNPQAVDIEAAFAKWESTPFPKRAAEAELEAAEEKLECTCACMSEEMAEFYRELHARKAEEGEAK